MKTQIRNVDALISSAADYLDSKLGYSPETIRHHMAGWIRIRKFMALTGIQLYSRDVEKEILYHYFKARRIQELSPHEKEFHNSIRMLTEFEVTGKIKVTPRMDRRDFIFEGPIGELIVNFIDYKKTEDRLSTFSILSYRRYLFLFFQYCKKKGTHSIEKIDLPFILHYIDELDCLYSSPVNMMISTLRGFIKYLFEQKILTVDYSIKIPKCKSVRQPKLPSTYTKKEIEKLIRSVERSSANGKRNYAIILIAARLGLRASDICRLKFNNLNWHNNTIEIKQAKTGKELVLPLLPDIGNAIIDYLKYGRPESEEPYVFLTERPPFEPFPSSNVITHVVQRAFRKAGIDIKDRKFGSHCLRHSLGCRMLEQHTILPVISEVLGHQKTESTRYYLRIDLQSMKQCMLDVPPVSAGFYQQKGGSFYE
jgi:integrase